MFGDEVTVHHVEVKEVRAATEDFVDLGTELREVGREN